jgi:hypothetical protein
MRKTAKHIHKSKKMPEDVKNILPFVVISFVLLLLGFSIWALNTAPVLISSRAASVASYTCPTDLKRCPNGMYVYRSYPSCQFSPCDYPVGNSSISGKAMVYTNKSITVDRICPPPTTATTPLAKAKIELWGAAVKYAYTVYTESDGSFSFQHVPNGVYNVCLKTPYPYGYTKYCIKQQYSFPNEKRDPFAVNCARVEVNDQTERLQQQVQFFLKPINNAVPSPAKRPQ